MKSVIILQESDQPFMNDLAQNAPEQHEMLLICTKEISYSEMAFRFKVPIGTIKSRLYRVRRKLEYWRKHNEFPRHQPSPPRMVITRDDESLS